MDKVFYEGLPHRCSPLPMGRGSDARKSDGMRRLEMTGRGMPATRLAGKEGTRSKPCRERCRMLDLSLTSMVDGFDSQRVSVAICVYVRGGERRAVQGLQDENSRQENQRYARSGRHPNPACDFETQSTRP